MDLRFLLAATLGVSHLQRGDLEPTVPLRRVQSQSNRRLQDHDPRSSNSFDAIDSPIRLTPPRIEPSSVLFDASPKYDSTMALKPSLALKLGQQLRMTPQLQQAIKLLQLSTLDLQQEIQDALDSNLMLEEFDENEELTSGAENQANDDPDRPAEAGEADGTDEAYSDEGSDLETANPNSDAMDDEWSEGDASSIVEPMDLPEDPSEQDSVDLMESSSLQEELAVDSNWDDVYEPINAGAGSAPIDDYDPMESKTTVETLAQHLLSQLELLNLSEHDAFIAWHILDGLDAEGQLTIELEDILESAPEDWLLEMDEIEAVLHLIQHLDPIGVAHRSLQECLLIQLRALPVDTPARGLAIEMISDHLAQLGTRDFATLTRKLRVPEPELSSAIELIKTLNPRPGSDYADNASQYVEPDVMVRRREAGWVVEINPAINPKIRVNPEYAALIRRNDTSSDQTYLKEQMQEARWFIKSLQQRNETLLRVATEIMRVQKDFLDHGDQGMRPLVLHDIAEAVGLHESTISRVTTQKYIDTPMGIFELKYFFSSHVSTHSGGEVSSTAIRALIKNLIADENTRKPLSDNKIAALLAEQNINVARRTVAKYREALMIPPSNERKELN